MSFWRNDDVIIASYDYMEVCFIREIHCTVTQEEAYSSKGCEVIHSRLLPICDAFFIQRGHRRSLPLLPICDAFFIQRGHRRSLPILRKKSFY